MWAAGTTIVFLLQVPLTVAFWHSAAWPADVTPIPHPLE